MLVWSNTIGLTLDTRIDFAFSPRLSLVESYKLAATFRTIKNNKAF